MPYYAFPSLEINPRMEWSLITVWKEWTLIKRCEKRQEINTWIRNVCSLNKVLCSKRFYQIWGEILNEHANCWAPPLSIVIFFCFFFSFLGRRLLLNDVKSISRLILDWSLHQKCVLAKSMVCSFRFSPFDGHAPFLIKIPEKGGNPVMQLNW